MGHVLKELEYQGTCMISECVCTTYSFGIIGIGSQVTEQLALCEPGQAELRLKSRSRIVTPWSRLRRWAFFPCDVGAQVMEINTVWEVEGSSVHIRVHALHGWLLLAIPWA